MWDENTDIGSINNENLIQKNEQKLIQHANLLQSCKRKTVPFEHIYVSKSQLKSSDNQITIQVEYSYTVCGWPRMYNRIYAAAVTFQPLESRAVNVSTGHQIATAIQPGLCESVY